MNIGFALSPSDEHPQDADAVYAWKLARRLSDAFGKRSRFLFRAAAETADAWREELTAFIVTNRIELLVVPDPYDTPYPELMPACLPDGTKLAVYAQDVLPQRMRYRGEERTDARLERYEKCLALLRRADLVWTNLETTRLDASLYAGVAASRVYVIRAGVDAAFRPLPAASLTDWKQRMNLAGPYVLASGAMPYGRGIGAVTAIFAAVLRRLGGRRRLVWIDAGPREELRIRREAARHGLDGEQVAVMARTLTDEELVRVYNGADLLLYPARYEGFAFPPLLAMACGTPILAADHGALNELCGDSAVYGDPDDVKAMAGAAAAIVEGLGPEASARSIDRAQLYRWPHVVRAAAKSIARLTYTLNLQPVRYRHEPGSAGEVRFSFSLRSMPRQTVITGAVLRLPVLSGREASLFEPKESWPLAERAGGSRVTTDRQALVSLGSIAAVTGGARPAAEWECAALVRRWKAHPAANLGLAASGLRTDETPELEIRYAYVLEPLD